MKFLGYAGQFRNARNRAVFLLQNADLVLQYPSGTVEFNGIGPRKATSTEGDEDDE
ncbi:MAG: hypothetical protein ABSC62_15045 [Terracidiphilus sp.]|jgi:hypothetical protein